MKYIWSILGALAIIAGLHIAGLLAMINLVHPFWAQNATLYGSLIGALLSALVFWIGWHKPRLGRSLAVLAGVVFVVALGVTLYAAKAFIEAADFERMAANIWHKGAYTVFASAVICLSALLAKAINMGKAADS